MMAEEKPFDFSLFSDKHLVSLLRQVYSEVLERRERLRRAREQRAVPPEAAGARYSNPDNPAETWSGKGRIPTWMTEALALGHDLASLLEV